jgi:hypothetical protein
VKVRQIASIAALALVLPAGAQAADSTAPQGSAAVDQYRESVPPGGSGGRKLTKGQRDRLAGQGTDGRDLAAVLERNGGVPAAQAAGDGGASTASKPGSEARPDDTTSEDTDTTGAAPTTATGGPTGGSGLPAGGKTLAASSASSTVGPFPVWGMVVAAFAIVGVAGLVRHRAA